MDEPRRKFHLASDDTEYLDNSFPGWETLDGGWLLLHHFPIRTGFTVQEATVAIQIHSAYPATALDMAYFFPAILRSDGKTIAATQVAQQIDGKPFQRWSRHYRSGTWKPNEDNLATHVLAIKDWLDRAAPTEVVA